MLEISGLQSSGLQLQSHLLHGLFHCNGFGHLLSLNGRDEGSKLLSDTDLMDLFDRLCYVLRARLVPSLVRFDSGGGYVGARSDGGGARAAISDDGDGVGGKIGWQRRHGRPDLRAAPASQHDPTTVDGRLIVRETKERERERKEEEDEGVFVISRLPNRIYPEYTFSVTPS